MHSLPSPVSSQHLHVSSHVSILSLCPAKHSRPLFGTQTHLEGSEMWPVSERREKTLWNQAGPNLQNSWKLISSFSWCPWFAEENFCITQGQKYTFKLESLGFELELLVPARKSVLAQNKNLGLFSGFTTTTEIVSCLPQEWANIFSSHWKSGRKLSLQLVWDFQWVRCFKEKPPSWFDWFCSHEWLTAPGAKVCSLARPWQSRCLQLLFSRFWAMDFKIT